MNEKYQLTVNSDSSYQSSDLTGLDVNSTLVSPNNYHVLKNNKSFTTEITAGQFDQKRYVVKVNNNTYTVNIQNHLDQLIKQLGFSIGTNKQVNAIKAPMPGLILEISVQVGQEVLENDNLLILEAMKMENNLSSPRAGIIKSISVSKGDTVEKGQLLIEFE
ncbi:acetyl-CoA carboxylase biotin carboxyl carrier protein subunit [Flavobacterium sp. NKUCC04_CG]|uniref:acetyl-CoA carboxylase biotin carboxyl carrier protein subunit n=1 Tax=Flavobacterium sp. NKUCC04_CG TaxID=2842121 RepID=UPI001C5BDDA0|nr:acetyl-CoA carboxylase biotin carboxyl carrier protein subunit [Flavobacterium sp. NKUCC04_CG]MBW3518512.1 acetyl-CoA carboxylase biotin carboxyl carrier protein subunit [Flavobacterium sp. NKUCC04_CG]